MHEIRNDDDHRAALRELSRYFDREPEPGSEEGDRFEMLLSLVEKYEAMHFPINAPDPIDAMRFRMKHAR